ncbi:MAG: hypothetical protein A2604_00875 [Candidatus Liptonbacteria bacterium RIFOXYD1_FULL_36_11]|uniref:HD domain-containing protein n=1 Tax=Candidatus Liptonbacteria bacterium RIFOXYD1_FULL_36_11 TaxID=1798656 RepID=A0A1G2CSU5_9BACT|nr:MAG: hypothetical protein A2604_00875 [Candidatus Liptonbacteria bacterium RIFOXYD1_FULL_36_11]
MKIPEEIITITKKLEKSGFEAFLVGGCVRDLILNREPKDWDITTNARPEETQKIFSSPPSETPTKGGATFETFYENQFGTVGIKTSSENPKLKIVEITTYRIEGKYTDQRHPDEIKFAKTIEEDLSRRDFTINAIAMSGASLKSSLVDPFGGENDLKNKIIRAVGDAKKRFQEDALRLLRAVRLSVELNFAIEKETLSALKENSLLLKTVSKERIRDEFIKIINTPEAALGIRLLEKTDLLRFIIPELLEGVGNSQNKHHIYDVFEHNVLSLDYAAKKNYSLEIRLASLLHDVGKPRTKNGEGENATFYAHEIVGAKMTRLILQSLCFPVDLIEKITHLVRYHLFYYNVGEVSEAGVRRFLARVGIENIDNLLKVREADRIGSGVPKAFPYKLRHLLYMIDKVRHDPISPKALKINGTDLMDLLKIPPSPRIGMILNALLEEVMDDPSQNTEKHLEKRAKELHKLSDAKLAKIMAEAKAKQADFEKAAEDEIKKKHHVN